jgi:hypothetical protein
MQILEFNNKINEHVKNLFPNGLIIARIRKNLGQFVAIDFGIIRDKKDWINGYFDNDLVNTRLIIHLDGQSNSDETYFNEKIKIEMQSGWSLNINPPEGSYLAIGSHSLKWRNKTARAELVLKHVLKYFDNLRESVNIERDKNNIYRQGVLDEKYFQ